MKGMNLFRNYCFFTMLCMLVLNQSAEAQASASIYMQTENNQPFELRWNGKNYASSSSGYMVLPQVGPGKQPVVIVFYGEMVSEFTFTIDMSADSKGYSLRLAVDNTWSLIDMVDLTVLKGIFNLPVAKAIIPERPLTPIPKPVAADKSLEKIPVKFIETPVVKTEATVPAKPKTPMITGILKIFDKSGNSGIDQVYVLTNGIKSDTIALFIPVLIEEIPKTGTNPAAANSKKQPPVILMAGRQPAIRQRYTSITK